MEILDIFYLECIIFSQKSLKYCAKLCLHALEILRSISVRICSLFNILQRQLSVQFICLASHIFLRPSFANCSQIIFPICRFPEFSIKKRKLLFVSYSFSQALINTFLINKHETVHAFTREPSQLILIRN